MSIINVFITSYIALCNLVFHKDLPLLFIALDIKGACLKLQKH